MTQRLASIGFTKLFLRGSDSPSAIFDRIPWNWFDEAAAKSFKFLDELLGKGITIINPEGRRKGRLHEIAKCLPGARRSTFSSVTERIDVGCGAVVFDEERIRVKRTMLDVLTIKWIVVVVGCRHDVLKMIIILLLFYY